MILFTIATIAASSIVQHQITKKRIEANSKLRELREEYARKRQEHQHELAMRLMREGQQLQLQLQQEMFHAQMKQVKTSFVNELQLMVDEMAYKEWPLKVLPWVIQNQSLGNILFAGDESGKFPERDRFAMHCILLPSSSPTFNTNVWLPLESQLEAFCNQYWNSSTGRPVLFYSGSWNRIDPALGIRGIKKPAGNDIGMLYDSLNQLPTILIQPDFDLLSRKLKVTVTIWGMPEMEGKHSETYYPDKFQRNFDSKINYRTAPDAAKEAIEDLTPYLESLIGYMADTYFWHASNAAPLLPSLIKEGVVNTDGMPYIRKSAIEFYNDMLKKVEEEASKDEFFSQNISNLFRGISVLWNENGRVKRLTSLYIQHVNHASGKNYTDMTSLMVGELNMTTSKSLPEGNKHNIDNTPDRITIECRGVKFDMIRVKAGKFLMGCKDFERSQPIHEVEISRDFYIAETPVTIGLWESLMGKLDIDKRFVYESERPATSVSYFMVMKFIEKLNEETAMKFRLPTEAEWEYAARGGQYHEDTIYSGSNNIDEVACHEENSYKLGDANCNFGPHKVKTYKPNALGIYDMSGNVLEFCADSCDDNYYQVSPKQNPQCVLNDGSIMLRGGAWNRCAQGCHVAGRYSMGKGNMGNWDQGVRLVL